MDQLGWRTVDVGAGEARIPTRGEPWLTPFLPTAVNFEFSRRLHCLVHWTGSKPTSGSHESFPPAVFRFFRQKERLIVAEFTGSLVHLIICALLLPDFELTFHASSVCISCLQSHL